MMSFSSYFGFLVIIYQNALLTWTTLTFVAEAGSTSSSQGQLLNVTYNIRLTKEGSTTAMEEATDLAHCVTMCLHDKSCRSVSFNTQTSACYANKVTLSSSKILVEYNEHYIYTEIPQRVQWHVAFRATSGNGKSVFDAWNNQGHHDDVISVTNTSFGCSTSDDRAPCDKHFRSWRLDNFENVSKVKFAFHTDSNSNFKVIFLANDAKNATDSFSMDKMSNLSKEQLMVYSNTTYNYDSVEGFQQCLRRFYLSQSHNSCVSDFGWMAVKDGSSGAGCCHYEGTGPYPKFAYSKRGSFINWSNSNDVGYAQAFVVSFKYRNKR